MIGQSPSQMIANHPDRDPVRLVIADCEKCGPDKAVRVFRAKRQCGCCGWVQGGEW